MNNNIKDEIMEFPSKYQSFRNKPDNYIFNGLFVKHVYYKNPSHILYEQTLNEIVVDGTGDNGIDCILTDLSSDHNDIIFIQCKYYDSISLEKIKEAISKMVEAYKSLTKKTYDSFNNKVVSQYLRCIDEMEEGAKIKFVFATSSPRNRTQSRSIINYFNQCKNDLPIEMDETSIFFEEELIEAIKEAKSLRPCVESDKLIIDTPNNVLYYGDDLGAVFNISALSLKELYGKYRNALLSQNLRYFVKNKTIDKDVDESIKNSPDEFWYKNNGITIICDDYTISSKVLKLVNFSIINGGQTTRKIYDSASICDGQDFFLMCRVIKNPHQEKEKKQQFIYEISKATNSQKAIKPSDLRANNPEQKLFEDAMLKHEVFYKTKRGEEIPVSYRDEPYKNCDLPKVGKLALAGLFLMPGTSRNKPSVLFDDQNSFYDTIFNYEKMNIIAGYIADLLYVDYYFDRIFIKKFKNDSLNDDKNRFASNCRTFVTAFIGFLCKYYNNEFCKEDLKQISSYKNDDPDNIIKLQKVLRKLDNTTRIFENTLLNLDKRDEILSQIFKYVISLGYDQYDAYKTNQREQDAVDETNWLKRDSSFYVTLRRLVDKINEKTDQDKFIIFKELFKKNDNNK